MIIVEVIKQVCGEKVKRYLPLIALVLGVVINVVINGVDPNEFVMGILLGGASAGIYDFTEQTILNDKY